MREGEARLRRPDRLHRAGGRRAAPHRGADPRRRRGQRDPPLRARLLGAAPPPEGRRDRPGAQPGPGAAGPDVRRRGALRDRRSATATRAPSSSCSTRHGNYVFIEMNPRIQVEHTVTEEVTDVDLVQSQMRIASGETLDDLGLSQDSIVLRGAALQCRITTEDPANNFRPDTGVITTYRSPGGPGIRVDGGTVYTGAEVSAHFDSMLAKLTCRGRTFDKAVEKARRAVAEFRIRGVSTNIPFLQAVLTDPDFAGGHVTTSFIETHPQLLQARSSGDRGSKLLGYLADVTVNQPHGAGAGDPRPGHQAARRQPRRARRRTAAASCCSRSARRSSPAGCARRRTSRSPTPPSATPTSRCSRPGSAPATCSTSPATSRARRPSCGRSRPGAARRTTWRCASSPRTRGSGWPRCARRCRTSACRCCSAAATRSATRRTPPT